MSDRARELAAAFDRSFAEPEHVHRTKGALALTIVAGGTTYVLPLADVRLVTRAPPIRPLPGGHARQLGIAGIRGNLVTVFSLTALLGEPVSGAEWIAVVGGVALAFDALEGQCEIEGTPPNLLNVNALLERTRA